MDLFAPITAMMHMSRVGSFVLDMRVRSLLSVGDVGGFLSRHVTV